MKILSAVVVYFAGMLLQFLWSTYFPVFGLAPQLLLVLTVAMASQAGPLSGQCYGFAWGLFLDVLDVHVFGANALLFSLFGYFVGMLRRQLDVASFMPQLVLIFILTPVYFLLFGLVGMLFERQFLWVGWLIFLGNPFYNCLVAPFAFACIRRFMGSRRNI